MNHRRAEGRIHFKKPFTALCFDLELSLLVALLHAPHLGVRFLGWLVFHGRNSRRHETWRNRVTSDICCRACSRPAPPDTSEPSARRLSSREMCLRTSWNLKRKAPTDHCCAVKDTPVPAAHDCSWTRGHERPAPCTSAWRARARPGRQGGRGPGAVPSQAAACFWVWLGGG